VPPTGLTDARLQLHHAAQIAVSAAISYVAARPDDSHTALTWIGTLRALATEPITATRQFRIALRLEDLTLHVLDEKRVQTRSFALPGHTAGSAAYLTHGVLFLGDSAGLKSNGTLTGSPWALSDDSAQNHQSLRALADRLRPEQIQIVAIAPAHTATGTFDALAQYAP